MKDTGIKFIVGVCAFLVLIFGVLFFLPVDAQQAYVNEIWMTDQVEDTINLTTDHLVYYAPADVNFINPYPGAGPNLVLYSTNTTSSPICHTAGDVGDNNLNAVCTSSGTFNSVSSTLGTYYLLQATSVNCDALSLENCRANNPGMPGQYEADFEILASSTQNNATSLISMVDSTLIYLQYLFDAGIILSTIAAFHFIFIKHG